MQNNINITAQLFSMQDLVYKDFTSKLIPTLQKDRIIGIRTPTLRKYAKTLMKKDVGITNTFLLDLPHYYYEENNLHAFIIENIKDFNDCIYQTELFLPYIDNWATCDSFSPKVFKKHPAEFLIKVRQWLKSSHTYTQRYAVGMLLSNYLDSEFNEDYLALVAQLKSDDYYVKMMQAWYFSVALVKQYDKAIVYFTSLRLDRFVHNKAIQKAIESYRIPIEVKDCLRTLRIQ